MNPVIHFEMPVKDKKRVADFYSKVFGWGMQQLGEEMGYYILATTTETDDRGMIQKPGAINGGFYEWSNDMPDNCPSVVIGVENLREHMKKAETSGGKVLGEPIEIPGIGSYVAIRDTEGNRVGILQPLSRM